MSARRRTSEASSTLGKDEKSSGFSMKIEVVKIRIANAKDRVRPISITQAGTGSTMTRMISIRPIASSVVGLARLKRLDAGMAYQLAIMGRTELLKKSRQMRVM